MLLQVRVSILHHGFDVLSVTGKEINHGLSPESKIISVMEKSLKFLNNEEYDYLIRTAVFHYLFGFMKDS